MVPLMRILRDTNMAMVREPDRPLQTRKAPAALTAVLAVPAAVSPQRQLWYMAQLPLQPTLAAGEDFLATIQTVPVAVVAR